jgi:hypothetical protein
MYKLAHLSRLCATSAVLLFVSLAAATQAHAQRKPLTLNDMKALEKSQI